MSIRTLLVLAIIAGAAYYLWGDKRQAGGAVVGSVDENGFMAMPQTDRRDAAVMILAAEGCTADAGQRADALAEALSARKIPFAMTSKVTLSFDGEPSAELKEKIDSVMGGEGPVVFVRGRAKANPSADEVAAELNAGRR